MNKLAVEPRYHNPSPLVWLSGHANKATVVVEGVETMALVDTGSQISALTKGFCLEYGLRILPWGVHCISKGQGYHDTVQGICRGYPHYTRFTLV